MTTLFKPPPLSVDGDALKVSAKPNGAVALSPGDRVFLWWSEAQGGAELVQPWSQVEATGGGKRANGIRGPTRPLA